LAQLPREFPWPLLITQHLPHDLHDSGLVTLLAAKTSLKVRWAADGDPLRRGGIYVARPHDQIEVTGTGLAVTLRRRISSSWLGSADLLLKSVAGQFGAGAIGVVLSGMLAAGVTGLRATIAAGGIAFAQSTASAEYPAMPDAAADLASVDWVASPQRIGRALAAFAEYQSL
jgi:two-component system chemotaxis response regulator CheB